MKMDRKLGYWAGLMVLGWLGLPCAAEKALLTPEAFREQYLGKAGRVDFVFGDDRPFQSCHASTVAVTKDGTVLCAWFGGTKEKDPDVAIWLSRFSGEAWSAPEKVAKINGTAHWNPVLFSPDGGRVYLFFKVGPEIPDWQTYWQQSDDGGKTWSTATELVAGDHGGRGPVRNKPIVLSDGAWLAGASTEQGAWLPFADRSEDLGKTWTRSKNFEIVPSELRGRGAIQPTLLEFAPGQVTALMRSQGGRVWQTDSADGGKTWSKVVASDLPNNNSGVDAALLPDGRAWIVYNPVGQNWGVRSPISIAESKDRGKSWQRLVDLDDEDMKEFSYPAIVAGPDGGVVISYTWKRERIRVWQIPGPKP